CASGIFPFRFCEQAISVAGKAAQPAHIILCVIPGNANHRMCIILRKAERLPRGLWIWLHRTCTRQTAPCASPHGLAKGCRHKRGPLAARDVKFPDSQPGDMNPSLWPFLVMAARLGCRRSHDEVA